MNDGSHYFLSVPIQRLYLSPFFRWCSAFESPLSDKRRTADDISPFLQPMPVWPFSNTVVSCISQIRTSSLFQRRCAQKQRHGTSRSSPRTRTLHTHRSASCTRQQRRFSRRCSVGHALLSLGPVCQSAFHRECQTSAYTCCWTVASDGNFDSGERTLLPRPS